MSLVGISRACMLVLSGYLLLGALVLLSCSKQTPVNPADAAQVRSIDATVERIRQAYVNRDVQSFQALLMPLESLRRVELDVERDFAIYNRISLNLGIDRVMIEGADVAVYFHWEGQWQRPSDEQPLRERGHAIFRLVGHQNLALSGIDGDAPFGMTTRRVPERAPGK